MKKKPKASHRKNKSSEHLNLESPLESGRIKQAHKEELIKPKNSTLRFNRNKILEAKVYSALRTVTSIEDRGSMKKYKTNESIRKC